VAEMEFLAVTLLLRRPPTVPRSEHDLWDRRVPGTRPGTAPIPHPSPRAGDDRRREASTATAS